MRPLEIRTAFGQSIIGTLVAHGHGHGQPNSTHLNISSNPDLAMSSGATPLWCALVAKGSVVIFTKSSDEKPEGTTNNRGNQIRHRARELTSGKFRPTTRPEINYPELANGPTAKERTARDSILFSIDAFNNAERKKRADS